MKNKFYLSIIALCFTVFGFSQTTNNDVLFTVDKEPVKVSEFLRVYNKNLDLVKDESQKDIDAYLTLFINYQLKVKEARRLGLNEDAQYKREFENYKKQLTKNFLSDNTVTDALVKEAYDRLSYDIKASHVLIRIDETEKDTLKVYNDLMALRKRIFDEGYEKVQKDVHDGETVFAEDLGYFSAFKMVYPFETAAYNTKVGDVSMPFRTRFGYHIVNVFDKRASRGEVTVAHIMISNNQEDKSLNPEVRIKEIYKKIEQGENFESLAKQFSDDKSSSGKGGLLAPFSGGQLSSQEFEDVAFGLKKKAEISEPFQSDYGWHIIKLINKKGIPGFQEMKPELEQRVKRDARSSLINSALATELKKEYDVKENKEARSYFESILTDDYLKRAWTLPNVLDHEKAVFTIKNKVYNYTDFGNHLMSAQKSYVMKTVALKDIVEKEYDVFLEASIINYHEENLEFENEEFGYILKEYRDGLLLFDLMEKQVWNAAINDSIGLQNYYEAHKNNYVWEDRVDAVVVTAAKEADISKVIALLKNQVNIDEINAQLNATEEQKVIITKGTMEANHQALPKDFEFKEGVSKIYNYNDAYHVINVLEFLPKSIKAFEEAKGKVVSDYQNFIEENWLKTLNGRYKVEVSENVLAKVKNKIKN
jgi:peptidyl-prolyl cis-trans isomerase SurA